MTIIAKTTLAAMKMPLVVEKDGQRYSLDIADDAQGVDLVVEKQVEGCWDRRGETHHSSDRFAAASPVDNPPHNKHASWGGAVSVARLAANEPDKVLAFVRGDLLFVFNFNPTPSFADYGILVPPASKWRHLFDTDEVRFGGQGRIQAGAVHEPALVYDSNHNELVQQIRLYLPARTAVALKRA